MKMLKRCMLWDLRAACSGFKCRYQLYESIEMVMSNKTILERFLVEIDNYYQNSKGWGALQIYTVSSCLKEIFFMALGS